MAVVSDIAKFPAPAPADAAPARPQVSVATVGDYVALMKPRVMSLVVFTALVGLVVAPGTIHPVLAFTALLCIAVGAGAAGALNMWYDADIDAVMTRTAGRPIPRRRIAPGEALGFGITLAGFSVVVLGLMVSWLAAALLAFTIFFYVVVYTMWLKRLDAAEHRDRRRRRRAPAGDRLGGGDRQRFGRAAAAVPDRVPVDAAAFLGAVAHPRRRLCARRRADAAGGGGRCRRRGGRFSSIRSLLVPVGAAPWLFGYAGLAYGATALVAGALMVAFAWRVLTRHRRRARRRRGAADVRLFDPLSVRPVCRPPDREPLWGARAHEDHADMDDKPEQVELTEEQKRSRRSRSIALALILGVLVVLFYVVTLVKGPAVLNRPL